jgi:hypothetical protein
MLVGNRDSLVGLSGERVVARRLGRGWLETIGRDERAGD